MAADIATVVERVANQFVKQLTNAFEGALPAGAGGISEQRLAAALEAGDTAAAERLLERALSGDYLRVLVTKQPLTDHLLDVAQASADATRCMVRPNTSPSERLRPSGRQQQMLNETAVQQVESNLRSPLARRSTQRHAAAEPVPDDMVDTVVRIGVRLHGINVHVFADGESHRISVPARVRRRLERWSHATGITLHTVAFDNRGEHHSGHSYYHQRGIKSMTLDRMTKVAGPEHLREIVRGADVSLR